MDCGAEGEVVRGYRDRVTGQETLRDRCPTLRAFCEGWDAMLSDSWLRFCLSQYSNPTIAAERKFAIVPAHMARKPRRARSLRRGGGRAPRAPLLMPIPPGVGDPPSAP